ncbi:MAG: ATP synthase subunit I [Nitrospirota bacterium]|nr:ATP synthase subunit I [Nitrospirota bacterium]
MTMKIAEMAISFIAGAVLAGINYSGLWLTVKRLTGAKHPAFLSVISYVVRMSVVTAGFFIVIGYGGEHLLSCLAGFFLLRTVVTRRFSVRERFLTDS